MSRPYICVIVFFPHHDCSLMIFHSLLGFLAIDNALECRAKYLAYKYIYRISAFYKRIPSILII